MKKVSFLLLGIIAVVLALATLIEKVHGSNYASLYIYDSWWFCGLWALMAATAIIYIVQRKLHKRPITFLIHAALVCILTGALVTHLYGVQGMVHLRTNNPINEFTNTENQETTPFPFTITLKQFQVRNYPGTQSAMDYQSTLCIDNQELIDISMNNIGEYHGYRFYQNGYDEDEQGTMLAVCYDPWGIGITYMGYALLFISMVLFLLLPSEGFRKAISKLKEGKHYVSMLATICLLFTSCQQHSQEELPKTLPTTDASEFCSLYVYYNGRICPMQTLAYDFTTKIYGKPSYRGLTAEQVFIGWIFFPTSWLQQPMIKLKGQAQLTIGGKKYASYSDFFKDGAYVLDEVLQQIHSGKAISDKRSYLEANEKMSILRMVLNGQLLKLFPYQQEGQLLWLSPSDNLPMDMPEDKWFFVKKSIDYVGELAVMGKSHELGITLSQIRKYQEKEAADVLPSATLIRTEHLYNRGNKVKMLAMLLTTLGIVSFFIYLRYWLKKERVNKRISSTARTLLITVELYLTLLIVARGIIAQHLPLTNGYETMLFMAWCSLLLTLVLRQRFVLITPFGFLLSGLTLMVCMMGQSNPQITPLMPVLASPLLSMHVCIIMIAYALLAFSTLNALTSLAIPARYGYQHEQLYLINKILLYPALFCLAAGIFIGAIWANISWGRYWGWDPKEVWALITLLVYAVPLHKESIVIFRKPFWFQAYLVMAFLCVLFTYFGVNFILGGMHSYAG